MLADLLHSRLVHAGEPRRWRRAIASAGDPHVSPPKRPPLKRFLEGQHLVKAAKFLLGGLEILPAHSIYQSFVGPRLIQHLLRVLDFVSPNSHPIQHGFDFDERHGVVFQRDGAVDQLRHRLFQAGDDNRDLLGRGRAEFDFGLFEAGNDFAGRVHASL